MKYCEEFAALLDPYVDGELSGEEVARVRKHLETCPDCRDYVDGALAIRAAFPDVEETAVPEDFAVNVMAAVQELEAAKKKRFFSGGRRYARWRAVVLPLAACFALVALVQTLPGGGGKEATVSTASLAPAVMADNAAPADSSRHSLESAPQTPEAQIENDTAAPEEAPEALAPDSPASTDSAPLIRQREYTAMALPASGEKISGQTAPRAICLTAEEAGELLADLPYTAEEDGVRCYQLPSADFNALLEILAERDILPPAAETPGTEVLSEGYDLVYVTEE